MATKSRTPDPPVQDRQQSCSVIVLADSSPQFLSRSLKKTGKKRSISVEIVAEEYGAPEQHLADPSSCVYTAKADYILLFWSSQTLIQGFYQSPDPAKFASTELSRLRALINRVCQQTELRVILCNFPEYDDAVFGHYASKLQASFKYQVKALNLGLMDLCQELPGLFLCDISSRANYLGLTEAVHAPLHITSDLAFSLDFFADFAKAVLDIVASQAGRVMKCVILDLDNTVWGGVIGDDGVEGIEVGSLGIGKAFTKLQYWLLQLKKRGIILCVCSKNNEETAKLPFTSHPEMTLRLDDIAVFVANWESKADNIRHIQSILNIGFDSMVFIDDNPMERDLVSTYLPEVTVPAMPEDPAEYLPFLQSLNLFEAPSLSSEDAARTRLYQEEAKRSEQKASFVDEDGYLASLDMKMIVQPFNGFTIPRVAQLIQRCNQFNLRTIRHTETEVSRLAERADGLTLAFTMSDRFGDYGVISALILDPRPDDEWFIETWVMSCRVLKRGVEAFILNELLAQATTKGIKAIVGEYLPTAKNALVESLYADLGFTEDAGRWRLPLLRASQPKHFIERIDP